MIFVWWLKKRLQEASEPKDLPWPADEAEEAPGTQDLRMGFPMDCDIPIMPSGYD